MLKQALIGAAMAAGLLASGAANAAVVTFNDLTGTSNAGYAPYVVSDGGLTFTVGGNYFGGVWDGTSPNSNGTENLIYSSDAGVGALQITKQGGGAFNLTSLDLAISFYDNNPTETVFINGTPLVISQTDTTYNLNLSGVTSVDITGFGAGLYWTADNIVYSAATNVPEPVTLSLFGAGLVGAAALRRRKAKA
jgi:hypothetical protein